MPTTVQRQTVDLSNYPDLVVIYLGMRVNRLTGLKTLFGFGPQISASVDASPDGLLLHENFVFSLFPNARRYAAVLARCRYAAEVVALRPTPAVVANFPEKLRWNRLLARNLLSPRRNGSDLR